MGSVSPDNSPLKRTSVVAPVDDLERLRKLAHAEHRSLSQEIRKLISDRVKEAA